MKSLLKIQPDSRQVPNVIQICSDKKYNDVLYSYLQCLSYRDENAPPKTERYLIKKEISFSKIASVLGTSRQTISKRFKNLMDLNLIREDNGMYYLTVLPDNYANLIPRKTLDILNDALSDNSISTYMYLFNRYMASEGEPFEFTFDQVKTFIGISATTRSNDSIITNILLVLKKIGLIEYRLKTKIDESNFKNVKTVYEITMVTNEIKC